MSTLGALSRTGGPARTDVASIVVASVLGSFAFGIVMGLTLGEVLFAAIPAMYGFGWVDPSVGVAVGWAIHISHGTVLGLAFGGFFTLVVPLRDNLRRWVLAGALYGAVLWLTLATFLMPFWVGLVSPMAPPVPDPQPWSLLGHLLYGAYLGALIPIYRRH